MSASLLLVLSACILVMAILYSCVGHGGASGYIAILALFSLSPAAFKPTALVLNILVSAIATIYFSRAGHFSWNLFWPFAATSIPFSFLGGYLRLPTHIYQPLVGIVLLASAYRLFSRKNCDATEELRPSLTAALLVGAALGFLSGLTGVGGGIFLSPLLLLLGWGRVKEVSAVAALFILVNSTAGLLGHIGSLQTMPPYVPILAVAALAGGITGSFFGSSRIPASGIVRALSVVLIIAGFKLLFV
ncbi:MAG TPA: sulfite exporter TauE/SafE family protein [Desulfobacteria bacterium]|nr:sulfite exporter TauE/SafE family protein [Desulfobacteria bacterium]